MGGFGQLAARWPCSPHRKHLRVSLFTVLRTTQLPFGAATRTGAPLGSSDRGTIRATSRLPGRRSITTATSRSRHGCGLHPCLRTDALLAALVLVDERRDRVPRDLVRLLQLAPALSASTACL